MEEALDQPELARMNADGRGSENDKFLDLSALIPVYPRLGFISRSFCGS